MKNKFVLSVQIILILFLFKTMRAATPDYNLAVWIPADSNNYEISNRTFVEIRYIIIHATGTNSAQSTIDWFSAINPQNVSAHYLVGKDGNIWQFVQEKDIAFHAGKSDANIEPQYYNPFSIGIEHVGNYMESSWTTNVMYIESAKLVRYLCEKYYIPQDKNHILGHNEIAPSRKSDPGQFWDWDYYMHLINDNTPPQIKVIDFRGNTITNGEVIASDIFDIVVDDGIDGSGIGHIEIRKDHAITGQILFSSNMYYKQKNIYKISGISDGQIYIIVIDSIGNSTYAKFAVKKDAALYHSDTILPTPGPTGTPVAGTQYTNVVVKDLKQEPTEEPTEIEGTVTPAGSAVPSPTPIPEIKVMSIDKYLKGVLLALVGNADFSDEKYLEGFKAMGIAAYTLLLYEIQKNTGYDIAVNGYTGSQNYYIPYTDFDSAAGPSKNIISVAIDGGNYAGKKREGILLKIGEGDAARYYIKAFWFDAIKNNRGDFESDVMIDGNSVKWPKIKTILFSYAGGKSARNVIIQSALNVLGKAETYAREFSIKNYQFSIGNEKQKREFNCS
jgi:N-acetyl-anhydromuramyl-L-alanine amidase AmpD